MTLIPSQESIEFGKIIKQMQEELSKATDSLTSLKEENEQLRIGFSADNEITIHRSSDEGRKMIVIDDNLVSYVLITNTPGKYETMHSDKSSLKEIYEAFIK